MSGIVGIVNLDGAPVDCDLLARLTGFMVYRGPDAQQTWIDGQVGFGHTMLRTTFEAETEKQPLTLDGKVWLTADARIDGRSELISELEAKLGRRLRVPIAANGHGPESRLPNDAELILYAYEAWGEDSVKHLIGDFAFAIWDSRQRRLFCARDHFGVKPFYYAHVGNAFLFSNTLNCMRQHPSVSSRLNEKALGDFLLFEMNHDLSTTVFADVQRLPPAHSLINTHRAEPALSRYWTLPVNGRIRYKRSSDYTEHFKELMDLATRDRLRNDRIGIFMSGGLDSPAIAATARGLLASQGRSFDLQAYTIVYQKLIPDKELPYAELVAKTLGIPINVLIADDYELFERWNQPQMWRPEPIPNPFMAFAADYYQQIAQNCRVVLSGQGPDAVLSTQFPTHLKHLLQQHRRVRTAIDLLTYPLWNRRLPPIGFRTFLYRLLRRSSPSSKSSIPAWLNEDFISRMTLEQRYKEISAEQTATHPTHPLGHKGLAKAFWPYLFERDDADLSLRAIEPRYPFFDLRLVHYFLSIPVVRCCVNKRLLRRAMVGVLPESVRLRAKTPLAGDVLEARVKRGDQPFSRRFDSLPELQRYVIPLSKELIDSRDPVDLWSNVRLQSFHNWISHTLGAQE